jgi:hypothetical protein
VEKEDLNRSESILEVIISFHSCCLCYICLVRLFAKTFQKKLLIIPSYEFSCTALFTGIARRGGKLALDPQGSLQIPKVEGTQNGI